MKTTLTSCLDTLRKLSEYIAETTPYLNTLPKLYTTLKLYPISYYIAEKDPILTNGGSTAPPPPSDQNRLLLLTG